MSADRNLLFAVLALQADCVTREQFIDACTAWAANKSTPIDALMLQKGWLSAEDRADVERLVERKLKKHGGNVRRSLAEVAGEDVRQSLADVPDSDLRQSLAAGLPADFVVLATLPPPASSGQSRYSLSRVHAMGGIGRVWLAQDTAMGRSVALKELRPERAGERASIERFIKEARITGQLEHPGIVPIYELGNRPQDNEPFYTMRFIRGRTLAAAIRRFHDPKLPAPSSPVLAFRELLTAFLGACNAAAYAHSRGVIHRDLKPANIVLGDYGEVIVLDWGMAKLLPVGQGADPAQPRQDQHPAPHDAGCTTQAEPPPRIEPAGEADGQTVAGLVLGTPAYMPPEQAEGRHDLHDRRSDVYALGAILYEILTGVIPFEAPNTELLLEKVRREPPVMPRARKPGVPRPLEAVCLKALAKRQQDRYPSALALADDVQHWLADEPVSCYAEPLPVRAGRWARQHKPLVAGAGALLLTAVAALSLGLVLLGRANTEIQGQRDQAEANFAEAQRQRQQADAHLYRSLLGEARAIREAHGIGYRAEAWNRLEQAARLETAGKDLAELRQEAGACLGDFAALEPTDWVNPDDTIFAAFDLHPQGDLLAVVLNTPTRSQILIRNVATGQEAVRLGTPPGRFFSCVKFSTDGRKLFAGDLKGMIRVWELNAGGEWIGGKPFATVPPSLTLATPAPVFPFFVGRWYVRPIRTLTVSPDGTKLAADVGSGTDIFVWNLADASPAPPFSAEGALPARVLMLRGEAFSPRGDLMAAGFVDGDSAGVLVWDVATRKVKQTLRPGFGAVFNVCFSADGKNLACACNEGVALFDTVDFHRQLFVRGEDRSMVAFSPDGRLLAILAPESGVVRLWNIATNREIALPSVRDPAWLPFVRFTPDGKRLVSAGSSLVRIWNLAGGLEKRTLFGHSGGTPGLAFSPDGKLLASTGKDQAVRLWDLATGRVVRELRGFDRPPQSVAFHPDGRFLATTEYVVGGVKLWDVQSGENLATVPRDLGPAGYGASFSPDGKHFMVCGQLGLRIWNVVHVGPGEDGRPRMTLKETARPTRRYANSACFSPGSQFLAWADSQRISLWELDTGQKRSWPAKVFPFLALSFLPDGKQLALVNQNEGKIEVRDAADGQVRATFGRKELIHGRSIHTALTPDGAWLAVGGDKAVTVWDMNKRELMFALPQERGTIWSLAWSPDKSMLAVGSSHGGLDIWDLPRIKSELGRIGLGW